MKRVRRTRLPCYQPIPPGYFRQHVLLTGHGRQQLTVTHEDGVIFEAFGEGTLFTFQSKLWRDGAMAAIVVELGDFGG